MTSVFICFLIVLNFLTIMLYISAVSDKADASSELSYQKLYWQKLANIYYNKYLDAMQQVKKVSSNSSKTNLVTWRTVLGYSKNYTPSKSELSTRYKKLAMIYHPDQGGSDYSIKLLNLAKEKADAEIK